MTQDEEIKVFKIGNEQVLVDDLKGNIMKGADNFISTRNVSDAEKDAMQKAYVNIMDRISTGDGTLYLDSQNNLIDTTGEIKEDEYNSYGRILNYIIPRANITKRYKPEDERKDFSYKRFGNDLINELSGGNSENLSNFILTDQYNDETESRSQTERIRLFKEALDKVNKKYKDYDEKSYNRIIELLDSDGGISENEYYELGKLTGISDIGKLFYTGKTINPEQNQEQTNPYMEFQSWMQNTHPYNATNLYSLTDLNDNYQSDDVNDVVNYIYSDEYGVTDDDIFNVINKFISGDTDLKLEVRIGIDKLHKDGKLTDLGDGLYEIPNITTGNIGTAFIYDSKNKRIKEVRKTDLPYYQQQYINEYNSSILQGQGVDPYVYNNFARYFTSYNKEGGVLKAQNGIQVPDWFNNLYTQKLLTGWDTNKDDSSWTQSQGVHGTAGNLDDVYKYNDLYTKGNTIASDIQSYLDSGNYSDINQFITAYNEDAEKIRDFWTSDKTYNQKGVAAHNDLFKKLFKSRSELLDNNKSFYLGWDEKLKDIMGSTTWLRRMDQYEKKYDQLNDEEKKSRTHTIKLGGSEYKVYKKANGDIALLTDPKTENNSNLVKTTVEKTGEKVDPSVIHDSSQNTQITNVGEITASDLWNLPQFEPYQQKSGEVVTPLVMGTGRLLTSLGYNKSIENSAKKSVPLSLKNPYELYSPVTGAFGEMNEYRNQAAALRSRAKQLFGADSEKNAAIWAEYNKTANELERRGFLADNNEIKRTMKEALDRQEKNIALRNTIADYNREQISNFNAAMNKIEAARKLRDWQGINTFLKDTEAIITNSLNKKYKQQETDRLARNEIAGNTSNYLAKMDYDNWMKQANDYKTLKGDDWTRNDQIIYDDYKELAKKILRARLMQGQYLQYGYNWNPGFNTSLGLDWNNFYKQYSTRSTTQPGTSQVMTSQSSSTQTNRNGGILQTIKILKNANNS